MSDNRNEFPGNNEPENENGGQNSGAGRRRGAGGRGGSGERGGIGPEDVFRAADEFVTENGREPVNWEVREKLGGGSSSIISPAMRVWRDRRLKANEQVVSPAAEEEAAPVPPIPDAIARVVDEVWEKLKYNLGLAGEKMWVEANAQHLAELTKERQVMEGRVAEKQIELDKTYKELEDAEIDLGATTAKLREAEACASEATLLAEGLQKQLVERNTHISNLEGRLAETSAARDAAQQAAREATAKAATVESQLADVTRRAEAAEAKVRELEQKASALQAKVDELLPQVGKLESVERSCDDLRTRLANTESVLAAKGQEAKDADKRAKDAEGKLHALEVEAAALRPAAASVERLQRELAEARAANDRLTERLLSPEKPISDARAGDSAGASSATQ